MSELGGVGFECVECHTEHPSQEAVCALCGSKGSVLPIQKQGRLRTNAGPLVPTKEEALEQGEPLLQ